MPLGATTAVVGSTNPAKVEAVRATLARLAPGCVVTAVPVPSSVPDQPFGDEETRRGAEARARAALTGSGADLGFGLEGGVLFDGAVPYLISWVAAVAQDGRVGYASGLRMPLPAAAGPRLRGGEELAVIVDDLFHVQDARSAVGAIGLLTEGAVSRTEAFAQLVAMALAPHLRPDLYPRI